MALTPTQLGVSLGWVALNAYAEGYRAFQLRFSPRVVVRAHHLARHPHPIHVALAPLYCMALIHATRRARIVAWSTVTMIVGFVLTLRLVPQPWRGIVDGGVVVALGWGILAIVVLFARSLITARLPAVPSEVPTSVGSSSAKD